VYRARDRLLERRVALKLLHDRYSGDDEYVERFRREARSVARLSHPGIVTVIDRGEQDGHQFIVFEHVEGETLKQLVDREGPLPVDLALELALQIGRALSFAHGQGLVHRDVKPQNVLLNGDGRAKVTDFGIARSVDVESATTTGAVVGTSHYIAPEQAKGDRADAQSDVYALGAVLYELLSGEVPFPGDNFVTVALRHVHDPLPSLLAKRPELPLRLVSAVERALEKDPDRRFPSMAALVSELERIREELAQGGEQDATAIIRGPIVKERPAPPARRKRSAWPLVLILAGLALGAIAAGLLLFGDVTGNGKKRPGPPIPLEAVSSFDPFGDNHTESEGSVGYATDGDLSTAWPTERYFDRALTKKGVGIVVAAKRRVEPTRMTVWSSTPGFTAVVKAGNRSDGGFSPVSEPRKVGSRTIFPLDTGSPVRYFLIWITNLGGQEQVDINEVKAR
jgi:serine/threonine protein kinase